MSAMFLTKEELAILTGRKTKSKQVEQLRKMRLPFWVNAIDAPVVARSTIEGKADATQVAKVAWVPSVLRPEIN